MYFKILWNYFLGYVSILIEGYYIERFMNICNSQKIFLWNIKREKATIVKVNISKKDFKKLKEIARKTKCRVKIQNKKGIPFTVHKYQKRKIFFVLLLLIILSLFVLSNFIWNIEIIGNQTISAEEIKQVLEENEFKLGTWKGNVKTQTIINQLRLHRNDIAWVGIELQGTNAIVKIVEADKKPDIIDENDYCNLVATKDGIITKISATNGTPVVKEGDVITKGSVLVGGWLEGQYTGTRYVHANGEVQAKVWYSQKEKVPLKQTKKEPTQKLETKYSLTINNFQINLYKTLSKFKNYDTIEENKKLKLFSDFYLPIELKKITNQEYKEVEFAYTKQEAINVGIEQAKAKLNNQIENEKQVLTETIHTNETDEYVEVEVIYEIQENIATKEKIVF